MLSVAADLCLKVTYCSARELITRCRSITCLKVKLMMRLRFKAEKGQIIMWQARWKTSKVLSVYLISSSPTARSSSSSSSALGAFYRLTMTNSTSTTEGWVSSGVRCLGAGVRIQGYGVTVRDTVSVGFSTWRLGGGEFGLGPGFGGWWIGYRWSHSPSPHGPNQCCSQYVRHSYFLSVLQTGKMKLAWFSKLLWSTSCCARLTELSHRNDNNAPSGETRLPTRWHRSMRSMSS